jgi:predicted SAM-dependent methyltransferase
LGIVAKNYSNFLIQKYILPHKRLRHFARKIHLPTYYKLFKKSIFDFIDKSIDQKKLMVDVGAAYFYRRHWKIMDFSTDHYFFVPGIIDYNFDLTSGKKFPFENNSVSLFYSSHTLEHVPVTFCQDIFNEFYRCLKPGGCVRLTMPDFDKAANAFEQNNIDYFNLYDDPIEQRFLRIFAVHKIGNVSNDKVKNDFNSMSKEKFADSYISDVDLSTVKKFGHSMHVNWWNFEKAKLFLENAGFKVIFQSEPNKSKFAEFHDEKLFDQRHPKISMYVEAIKK